MPYPGLYPDMNKIIPYSKNTRFGFAGNIIDLESMKNMSIEEIVELYGEGYKIADTSPTIETAQGGLYISSGTILLIGIGVLAYLYFKHR